MIIKLSQKERLILAAIELNANKPLSSFSRGLGMKDSTIRYHVQNLIEKELLLGAIPIINAFSLGYMYYSILFSLCAGEYQTQREYYQSLCESANVSWIAKIGGEFQYRTTLLAKNARHLKEIFSSFTEGDGATISSKKVSVDLSFQYLGANFLSQRNNTAVFVESSDIYEQVELDEIDRRILRNLLEGHQQSLRELERELNVPFSTLRRRIARLEANKVIVGYRHRMNWKKLGFQRYTVLIYSRKSNQELRHRLSKFAVQHPCISGLVECFGEWDFELRLTIPVNVELAKVMEDISSEFQDVIRCTELIQIIEEGKDHSYPIIMADTPDLKALCA